MAKKSKETAPIFVMRQGDKLVGEMQMDREAIMAFPAGSRIRMDMRTGREPSRLRWYFSFLRKVIDATGCAPDVEALHSLIKLEVGYTVAVKVKGFTVLMPRSVSFSAMGEEEFSRFLMHVEKFLAENFGIAPQDVLEAA